MSVVTPTRTPLDHACLPGAPARAPRSCRASVYGPALLARGEVSAGGVAAFGDGGYADAEAALAAYDAAAAAVAAGFADKAERATRARRRGA